MLFLCLIPSVPLTYGSTNIEKHSGAVNNSHSCVCFVESIGGELNNSMSPPDSKTLLWTPSMVDTRRLCVGCLASCPSVPSPTAAVLTWTSPSSAMTISGCLWWKGPRRVVTILSGMPISTTQQKFVVWGLLVCLSVFLHHQKANKQTSNLACSKCVEGKKY